MIFFNNIIIINNNLVFMPIVGNIDELIDN